ncbi:efflux RND transporter permease subunit [Parasulfuritortus cantonensis]|uniref:Efflux RND transporter permease subunit n=2 Tax=Parasulfuritortus cantonensis TaxID=2528202 RepID=A0A4R1B7H9_9PROT|nr:efflux RND transporter permease subunit [Parasulfuritortus cantonensis]
MNIAGKLAKAFLTSKLTLLTIIAVTLTGVLALLVTPREYNPQIVVPAANIIVAKPGANTVEVENLIVKPLEAILNAQSGVDHTFGYATNDFGVVTVQFKVGQNQEQSLVKLYNQLMQNMDRIPPGAMQPMVKPINVDDVPIMTLTLSSAQYDDYHMREVAQRVLEQLRNVPGVSFTQIVGGRAHAVNVWLDAQRLDAAGLTLDQVDQMLRGSNVSAPLGELVQDNRARPLRLSGFLGSAEAVGKIVVGVSQTGRPVYLKDVARIEDGAAEIEEATRFAYGPASGKVAGAENPAVTLAIAKKAGTNAVVVANAVLAKLDELKQQAIPAGIEVAVTRNDGAKANEAVNELVSHLGIAIGSVVVILVIFLGWREAGIVTLTVPLILFVVLAVGLAFGQTINRITLFALILSLGLLVDAAIVVIENIHRHLHHGTGDKSFGEVLIEATNEIGNPTNVATIAVILAFIPMAFVTGMMGPFMAPIPFNVPVAMIASIVIAYMVVPWASNLWLRGKATQQALAAKPPLEDAHASSQDPLHRAYVAVIKPLIASRPKRNLTFLVVLGLLIGAMLMPAWQFVRPSGMNGPLSMFGVELKMLPNDNTNTMLVQVDMPAGTALAGTDQVAREVGRILAAYPHVTDYQTFLGLTAPIDFAALVRGDMIKRGQNLAQIRVNLVGKHARSESSHAIADVLNQQFMAVRQRHPTAKIKLYETPPGPPVQAQILAELYGPDYGKLRAAAALVNKDFQDIYGMINADDSVTANAEGYHVHVDTEKALLSGVAPGQVAQLLRNYVSGFAIGTLHTDDAREPVDITVRLPRELRATPETLLSLRVSNPHGMQVPLSAIATVEKVTEAKPIYDRDQHPMVMVGGELLKSSPVYAVLSLDKLLDGQKLDLGDGKGSVTFSTGNLGFVQASPKDVVDYTLLWGGEMRLTLDVFRDLGSAFMVAIVLIYLVLVGYYKSFVLPLVVMGAIPLTLVGVFPGHWATGQAFTATSMIGVIALAGIVVRNSLLLIDFILDYRKQGYGLEEAVIEAGAVRFRPILLTALAIILGSAIMITDPVFGGLAVSLIFGTFASTLLTLVVIPLLYYLWQRRLQTA